MDSQYSAPMPTQRAVFNARKMLAEHIYRLAFLEGVDMPKYKIQCLIDGFKATGEACDDVALIIRLKNVWARITRDVLKGQYCFNEDYTLMINGIITEDESLSPGTFRTQAGGVSLVNNQCYMPPKVAQLPKLFNDLSLEVSSSYSLYDAIIIIFRDIAVNQYFDDGNKRTATMLMNGLLLANGFDAITVPASEATRFHNVVFTIYEEPKNEKSRESLGNFLLECQKRSPLYNEANNAMLTSKKEHRVGF